MTETNIEPAPERQSIAEELCRAAGVPGRDLAITIDTFDKILRRRALEIVDYLSNPAMTNEETTRMLLDTVMGVDLCGNGVPRAAAERIAVGYRKNVVVILTYGPRDGASIMNYGVTPEYQSMAHKVASRITRCFDGHLNELTPADGSTGPVIFAGEVADQKDYTTETRVLKHGSDGCQHVFDTDFPRMVDVCRHCGREIQRIAVPFNTAAARDSS